jgi:Ca-activated chloride channel homolog
MTFASPLWFLLFFALIPLVLRKRQPATPALRLPLNSGLLSKPSWRSRFVPYLPWLRGLAVSLLIIALARPQRQWQEKKIKADALDIVLSIDLSSSMLCTDFEPDRLSVAKRLAIDFVEKRPYDRIGLVGFSGEAFTQCPLTTDRKVVQQFIRDLQTGYLKPGTAIGLGLATAVNRLKDSEARSRIVILLTDGKEDTDEPPLVLPDEAIELAATLGIRVYSVGIGTEGYARCPYYSNPDGSYEYRPMPASIDIELLQKCASTTGGKFYRAFSEADLAGIYDEIDRLEKTRIEMMTIQRTTDWFQWFVVAGLLLLALEMVFRHLIFRSITS